MKEIIKEAKQANFDELLVIMLYATYFVDRSIAWVHRIMKELNERGQNK